MGRDVHAPGFYVHLEPSGVFSAAGIWHPDPATLTRVRDFIVRHPAQWKKVINDAKFRELCALEGDVLSRPPKGYDPGHPLRKPALNGSCPRVWSRATHWARCAEFTKPSCRSSGELINQYVQLG
jgi:hypothetical protein